jgi:hypothetical protein
MAENKELNKTLAINGDTYNINAVKADKVENTLVIKQIGVDIDSEIQFDGSTAGSISIVSAEDGGRFKKTIHVPASSNAEFVNDEVLNYGDLTGVVLKELKNNSVLYEWDGSELQAGTEGNMTKSVSIITGAAGDVNSFAAENYESKHFSAYIYVADDGNIYFGTSDSDKVAEVKVSADTANRANQLTTARVLSVDLASSESAEFDGTADAVIGVDGILPEANGGTGVDSLSKATVGKANQLAKSCGFITNLGTTNAASSDLANGAMVTSGIAGVLQPLHGGTGTTDLSVVTVGTATKANSVLITRSSNNGATLSKTYNNITISQDSPSGGENGDIWIKY